MGQLDAVKGTDSPRLGTCEFATNKYSYFFPSRE